MAVRWGWLIVLGMSFNTARTQEVGAPRSLEAVAYSPAEIRLYWLPATGATGYRITRDGSDIAVLPGTAAEYADTGLTPASTHRYTVQAVKGDTQSPVRTYIERTFSSFPTASGKALPVENYDVVVVQASSGGVSAAIEAARRGLKVALIEPTTRLGGMPVNGLSATDLR